MEQVCATEGRLNTLNFNEKKISHMMPWLHDTEMDTFFANTASQATQSPCTGSLFYLSSSLDGYSFANVKGIIEFKH